MIYQVEISPSNQTDFIQIIESLKNLGVVKFFKNMESLARPGDALSENQLTKILLERGKEMDEGNFLTHEEMKKFLKLWRLLNQK